MAFLLNVDREFTGGTRLVFDIGPAERVQMLAPTASTHATLDVHPDGHIGLSLTDVRPPAKTRRRG